MKNRNSRIYIAGHQGLVGSAIKRRLEYYGYSNLLYQTSSNLNLERQQEVEYFFSSEKPEFVFLAAAKVGGILANKIYPADFIYNNLMIQSNIIHSSFKYHVKKLMFLGSSCIYPKFVKQPIREEYLLTDSLEPTNEAYAIAKISGLKLCRYYNQQYGTNFLSVMPTNLFGPNDNYNMETSHVLPALIRKIYLAKCLGNGEFGVIENDLLRWRDIGQTTRRELKKEIIEFLAKMGIFAGKNHSGIKLKLWGSGDPRREFLFVDDLAEACVFLMQNYSHNEIGEYVNVGVGRDISIRELAEMIVGIIGFDGQLEWDQSKPDGTPRKLLNINRIKKLGWEPSVSLREGIARTVRDYLKAVK